MTLYLKVGIGRATFLLAAARATDLGPADRPPDRSARVIDCRRLFGAPDAAPGYRVLVDGNAAEPLWLVVDRFEGLVERGEDAFRPLPAIGRLGRLIDAVAVPVAAEPPALRLHIEPALLAGASLPPGE